MPLGLLWHDCGIALLHADDDWFEAGLDGGQAKAHLDVTREFGVEWQYLPIPQAWLTVDVSCHLVFFRVLSIGKRAHDSVTPLLLRRGCALGQPPCGDGHSLHRKRFYAMMRLVERVRHSATAWRGKASG